MPGRKGFSRAGEGKRSYKLRHANPGGSWQELIMFIRVSVVHTSVYYSHDFYLVYARPAAVAKNLARL